MKYFLIYISFLIIVSVQAATWYASSNGTETNGTYTHPWSILYSVTNTNPYLAAGDTVIFKNGTYSCPEYSVPINVYNATNVVFFRMSGSSGSPITYQAENLWQAKFDGGFVMITGSHDIQIKNVHIYFSGITPRFRSNDWSLCSGINIYGTNINLYHNLIENEGQPGIGFWQYGPGDLSGNIVRFCGVRDYPPASTPSPRGNAMYLENNTPGTTIKVHGNLMYYTYTHVLKPKNNTIGFDIVNNIISQGFTDGILVENDDLPILDITLNSNYVWSAIHGSPSIGIRSGYEQPPLVVSSFNSSNVNVIGNVIVGGMVGLRVNDFHKQVTVSNNVIARINLRGDGSSDFPTEYKTVSLENYAMTNSPVYNWDRNSYYSPDNGDEFLYWGMHQTWAEWSTNGFDANSTFTVGTPTGVSNYVFRPTDDANFLHVAVFNWPTNSSTTIDLSSYFAINDKLEIFDSQNIPTAFSNFVYSGGSITLPLTLTNRAVMIGDFLEIDPTNYWSGFDPRFRAFVVHKYGKKSVMSISNANITNLRIGL